MFVHFAYYVSGVFWVIGWPLMFTNFTIIISYYSYIAIETLIITIDEISQITDESDTFPLSTSDTEKQNKALQAWIMFDLRRVALFTIISQTCQWTSIVPLFGGIACVFLGILSWFNEIL